MKTIPNMYSQFLAILLIVTMGVHSLNSFFYTHSHQLADGTIITHAHPFDTNSDTDPIKAHEHSESELVFLAILSYFLPIIVFALLCVNVTIDQSSFSFAQLQSHQHLDQSPLLRGPPTRL